jgi:hypothetical protein
VRALLPLLLVGSAFFLRADDFTDLQTYFARQPNQVFREGMARAFKRGLREAAGDRLVLTWEGSVDGRSLYLEVRSDRLKLITDKGVEVLRFRKARRLRAETWPTLDPNNAELYVSDGEAGRPGVLCIESFAEGMHRSTPDKEVYVVVDPVGRALLYRMPRRHASALSLVRMGEDAYGLPVFTSRKDAPDRMDIQYFRLSARGLRAEGVPLQAQYAPGEVFRFRLLP